MVRDFWMTGVGVGAYQRGMLVYQQSKGLFYFNHAHNEYLQLAAEGGALLCVPAGVVLLGGLRLIARRLSADRSPVFWIRAGAATGLLAVAVQSVWDTRNRLDGKGPVARNHTYEAPTRDEPNRCGARR